jgi:hypothetical protein
MNPTRIIQRTHRNSSLVWVAQGQARDGLGWVGLGAWRTASEARAYVAPLWFMPAAEYRHIVDQRAAGITAPAGTMAN